jgi:hypothetical protein
MLENFSIMDENPNDALGGGGCLCSDTKVNGCNGPYAVFNAVETDFIQSPYPVIGAACLCKAFGIALGEEVDAELVDDVPDV